MLLPLGCNVPKRAHRGLSPLEVEALRSPQERCHLKWAQSLELLDVDDLLTLDSDHQSRAWTDGLEGPKACDGRFNMHCQPAQANPSFITVGSKL